MKQRLQRGPGDGLPIKRRMQRKKSVKLMALEHAWRKASIRDRVGFLFYLEMEIGFLAAASMRRGSA